MTKAVRRVIGPVDMTHITRERGSVNGNPRYSIHTVDHGSYRTAPDAAVAYELPNWTHWQSEHNRHACYLHLDGRGNVVYIVQNHQPQTTETK
jgi:hypothetical protein